MQELVARIMTVIESDENTAHHAVALILGFLKAEGDEELIAHVFRSMPEAYAVAESSHYEPGILGGIMGLGSQLAGLGIHIKDLPLLACETLAFAREKAGDDAIDDVISAIPGLGQFV
jgi:hypothetical protein